MYKDFRARLDIKRVTQFLYTSSTDKTASNDLNVLHCATTKHDAKEQTKYMYICGCC